MTDEERYGTIRAIPRNPVFGAMSDAAEGLRDFGNKAQIPEAVPLVGGQGAGDLFIGQAPEEYDRWAHGFHPFKDRNVPGYAGLRGIPEIQEQRAGPLTDALFLGVDATGVGMGVRALGKAGGRQAVRSFNNVIDDTGRDASRRQFVKNAGVVGATAAAAAATPKLLKGLTRTVAKAAPSPTTAATRVAKNAFGSVPEYYNALRRVTNDFPLYERLEKLRATDPQYQYLKQANDASAARRAKEAGVDLNDGEYHGYEAGDDMTDEFWALDNYDEELLAQAQDSIRKEQADALELLRKENPDFADLPTHDEVYAMREREIPRDFTKRTGYLPTDNDVALHLRRGGTYTDPVTGNTAYLIPDAPPPMPGHKGTRFDIEWESPSGTRSPYQHWLPKYVPDEEIGAFLPSGAPKSGKGFQSAPSAVTANNGQLPKRALDSINTTKLDALLNGDIPF